MIPTEVKPTWKRGEMTLEEMAAELQRQQYVKADYVADTRRMNASWDEAEVTLTLDGAGDDPARSFEISDHAHGQLAARLKIPKTYYDRMLSDDPDLLTKNINGWLWREPEQRMLRTYSDDEGGGTLRAYLSNRYRRLDNIDLAEAVLPVLGQLPDVNIISSALTETRMYLKATLPGVQAEIRAGDIVQSGVIMRNSEIGAGRLLIAPFILRLKCINGMTVEEWGQSKHHVGKSINVDEEAAYAVFSDRTLELDDQAFFAKVADLVKAACDEAQFERIVRQLKDTTELRIESTDTAGVVEKLTQKHNLTEKEGSSVLTHLIEGGDLSAWGYVNAVTRSAQDVDDYDRRYELEALGAKLAFAPRNEWAGLAA